MGMTEERHEFVEATVKALGDAGLAVTVLTVCVIGVAIVGGIVWINVRRHVHRPGRIRSIG